jgi:hypothetical protein
MCLNTLRPINAYMFNTHVLSGATLPLDDALPGRPYLGPHNTK